MLLRPAAETWGEFVVSFWHAVRFWQDCVTPYGYEVAAKSVRKQQQDKGSETCSRKKVCKVHVAGSTCVDYSLIGRLAAFACRTVVAMVGLQVGNVGELR